MEKFLEFWSHYNAAIIETLVALILISAIYLAYRSFFGAKDDVPETAGVGGGVNTVQIEKTLQKILDQQATVKASASLGAGLDGESVPVELVQELSQLKKALEEKEKQIVVLQEKAIEAASAAQSPGAGPSAQEIAAAANAAAGLAEKERQDYETKIKELEARLAEYEIISEDIADLSFYKEENARLAKELESIRPGSSASANSPPSASGKAAEPPPVAAAAPTPAAEEPAAPTVEEPVPDVAAAETPLADVPPEFAEDVAAAAEAPVDIPAEAPPETPAVISAEAEPAAVEAAPASESAEGIDDALMAEFAAAVEGQKSGKLKEPAADPNNNLLAEFENFNKKS